MIRATPPLGRGLANPQKCGILKSQGGRRWQQRALRTEHEDLWRGDFRTSQRARAHAEGVGRADQEKGWDSDRARVHQRYRARPPWPASAGFRGATGGGIGSSTRRPAVLCRTASRGRAGGTARSFAPTDRGGLSRVPEGVTEKARRLTMRERTLPRRQPRPVYFTREQLDELCERLSWASAWNVMVRS